VNRDSRQGLGQEVLELTRVERRWCDRHG
jgi:hypothetical protein